MKTELTTSEVNTLIAALMITGVQYEYRIKNNEESKKYNELEAKFRKLCYYGDEIATLSLTSNL